MNKLEKDLTGYLNETHQKKDSGKKATFDKTIKNKTMDELVFKDIAKESNLNTLENGLIVEKETPIIGVDKKTYLQDKVKENWIQYNRSILELNKRYSEGIELVNGDILVRLFKKPIYTKNGVAKTPEISIPLRNGAYKEVLDTLAFHFIGIIVNADKVFETKFPKEMIVQVAPELTMTQVYGDNAIQYLKYGFYRDCDEDIPFSHLGYILIKQGHISSIIKDFDIEEFTKIKEYEIKNGIIL